MGKHVEVFKRYEKKYTLSLEQYDALMEVLLTYMKIDKHGKHTICNIYLDTDDFQLIRASIEKPVYKEKIRIRSYGVPKGEDTVFVELKKKYDGIVYKRRVSMTLDQMEYYLATGKSPDVKSPQIMKEIDYVMGFYQPVPKVYIAYDRLALFGMEDKALRITFDSEIRWREDQLSLSEGSEGNLILDNNKVLMEIKTTKAMPLWLTAALTELSILPSSFSKYGNCYKEHIAPNLVSSLKGSARVSEEIVLSKHKGYFKPQPNFNPLQG